MTNTKKIVPAIERQAENKTELAALKNATKYLIDLNDKNIPAVYRKQVKTAIENDAEIKAYVLERKLEAKDQEIAKLRAELEKALQR